MTEGTTYSRAGIRTVATGTVTVSLLPRAGYDAAYTPAVAVAGFAFDIQSGLHAFAGDRLKPFLTLPFSLALTPAGCDIRSRSDQGGEYLTVTLAPGREAALMDTRSLPQYSNGQAHGGAALGRTLRRLMLAPDGAPTAIEQAGLLLFDVAARRGRDPDPVTKPASSLTRVRMKALHDLVEERFADRLSIGEMADAVGLSASFFIRAFRAATGLTPHDYLTERRLAEARVRTLDRRQSLAAIAAASGFSSQAHMTSAFRDRLGLTPRRYRDALL